MSKHRIEYDEALKAFHLRLTEDLKLAARKVAKVEKVEELKGFEFEVRFPQNHERDYLEVIEMLEMSTDKTILIDHASFKAYVKNEWPWHLDFINTSNSYTIAGSSIKNF